MNTSPLELEICVLNRLKKRPGSGKNELQADIYGGWQAIDDAITRLLEAGRIVESKIPGKRGAALFIVRDYKPLTSPPAPRGAE